MGIKYYAKLFNNEIICSGDFQQLVDTLEILKNRPENVEIEECDDSEIAVYKDKTYLKKDILELLEKDQLENAEMPKKTFLKILSKEYNTPYKEFVKKLNKNEDALIEWDMCENGIIKRSNEFFNLIDLGLSSEELDKIFLNLTK